MRSLSLSLSHTHSQKYYRKDHMRSMNKQSRKGKWIEVTIERDPIKEEEKIRNRPRHYYNGSWHYPDLRYYDGLCDLTDAEIRIVHLDDEAQTFIETAYTNEIAVVPEWIDYINHDHRRRRRSPLLVSISYYTTVARPSWWSKAPPRFKNPIQAISLCAGGSHCLILELRDVNVEVERSEMLRDIVPLRRFLEDRRITVVGIGMEKFAKQAREELGIDVVNPTELRSLIEEAFGDKKLRGRGDVEVEEMAEMVLDGMKNVREKEKKVKDMDWGREEVTEDALMYATRDAYFAFEIGNKCFETIGRKI